MKLKIIILCIFIILFCLAGFISFAEEDSSKLASLAPAARTVTPIPGGMQGKISLDLRGIDVVDALKFLALKANLNIITTKNVSGRVTLIVDNAPIQDVFDIMLRSNNLAFDKQGEIHNVMTEDEYKVLYGRRFADLRQVKTLRLKYAIPEQVFSLLDMLKSDIGRVLVNPESGDVFILDSPLKIKEMVDVLNAFEEKNIIKVFELNYAKAKNLEEQLKTQLDSKKVGTVKADEQGNRLIVQTLPERMKEIERLISILDEKTKQIIIDTQIVKVKLTNDKTVGMQLEGLFDLGRKFGMTYLGSYPFSAVQGATDAWRSRSQVLQDVGNVGSYPFSGTTSSYSASGGAKVIGDNMHLGIVGRNDFDAVFQYIQSLGESRVLSSPRLAVVNNQEARIHVGQKEAYVTTTTTAGGTGPNTISEQVTFVDVGVLLNVVPFINQEGYITLKLKAEISSVVAMLETPTKNKIPIIDTSLAETTVLVKEGSTIVIGGLRKDEKTKNVTKTPILGDIPILGKLFSKTTDSIDRTELLIILTPHIITGDVLVSTQGIEVGKQAVKPSKDYPDSPKDNITSASSEAFVPLESDNLVLKGARKTNQK
jgi:type IV pilus assembly protein PilQ